VVGGELGCIGGRSHPSYLTANQRHPAAAIRRQIERRLRLVASERTGPGLVGHYRENTLFGQIVKSLLLRPLAYKDFGSRRNAWQDAV